MQINISNFGFIDVAFDDSAGDTGNNGDTYTFTIAAEGQPCLLNGEQVEKFSFSIVGNFELNEFFEAIRLIEIVKRHKYDKRP